MITIFTINETWHLNACNDYQASWLSVTLALRRCRKGVNRPPRRIDS